MRRIVLMSVVVCLPMGASVHALSIGPGMRVYFAGTENVGVPHDHGNPLFFSALAVGNDWSTTQADYLALGLVNDVRDGSSGKYVRSPEIMTTGGGTAGWATLGMGMMYNDSPQPTRTLGTRETMDLLGIATGPNVGGDGVNLSVTVLGDGRGYTSGRNTGDTEASVYGFLDNTGSFSGQPNAFIVKSNYGQYAVWEGNASGDITDDDSDYNIQGANFRPDYYTGGGDIEILGDYMFYKQNKGHYSTVLQVSVRRGDGTYTDPSIWWMNHDPDDPTHSSNRVYVLPQHSGIAVGDVANDAQGGTMLGLYAKTERYSGNAGDGNLGVEIYRGITMFADVNGDDDAMEPGEQISIVDLDVSAPDWWATGTGISDIEFLEHDGNKFLIVVGGESFGNDWGTTLTVLELLDNGEFSNDWENDAKLIAYTGTGFPPATYIDGYFQGYIEVDVNPIPEPGTLLLLGTGAIGALGYVLRRRVGLSRSSRQ